ncbi:MULTISPECIES: Flp pilus assembly protein CpaB [Brevibacillus]|uniref:Pilus assembly protein CpaB n=1 Tax=Brevibacillus porteri TaxID=2126350 RepID=A0ABX5FK25_9BACL|nr:MULTISPECIES: RcpC/CpaB family pilus assembly protein [Brevibacillus]MDC0765151.1 RcpC/CpaB family pilus assembly protein [Brevibacillus sp. AG]MED1802365.1 RcpC/CpaB family pilus assembly protein [Brevibacillus porteri]MED2130876.1 RcpC/CpaB family pilus assembly protein [Brevibacillus porteri]MED2745633.1 RcpC/CpaB family pilus assembly protein [Brevibacillus porteri]MED2818138.1 RcpC/CpaB family pilus assembly protein [Brevibacillus porteri]
MSIHPLRLLAILLLATCIGIASFTILKPHQVTYIQLRSSVEKESGQLLEAKDMEPLTLRLGGIFQRPFAPIPGLIPWEEGQSLVGLAFTRHVKGGRPLLQSDLEQTSSVQGSGVITEEMTGMSIPIDNVAGVSPHVSSGERVHVYASFEDETGAHSGLLLQNMPIIGIQREMEGDHPNLVAVTLSLTRDEAVLLTHALHYGKIRLGLAAVKDGGNPGIGDAKFAAELMKTKTRWGIQKEEQE